MQQRYWIDPRDKGALLVAVMRELASDETTIALEGDPEPMAALSFDGITDIETSLCPPFSHQWRPSASVFVLPLTTSTLNQITIALLHEGRFVHNVGAIQIQRQGDLQFLVGDNFHHECVSAGSAIQEAFLQDLVERGIIRSFQVTQPPPTQ